MLSIIIPAYNEEHTVGECLEHVLTDAKRDGVDIDVVVACNGCTDNTAEVARRFGPPVKVVETPIQSKANALNLGDENAVSYPRVYLDSDVRLGPGALRRTAECLGAGESLIAAPLLKVDVGGASSLVRSYYRVWTRLPYVQESAVGAGFYAMSEAGRARFDRFPDITADDGYARLMFRPEERAILQDVCFTVRSPRTVRNMIKMKIRSHFGNRELLETYPQLVSNEDINHTAALVRMLSNPLSWADIFVYVSINLVIRALAWHKHVLGDRQHWERDESTRTAPEERSS